MNCGCTNEKTSSLYFSDIDTYVDACSCDFSTVSVVKINDRDLVFASVELERQGFNKTASALSNVSSGYYDKKELISKLASTANKLDVMNKIAAADKIDLLINKIAAEYKGRKVTLNKPFRTPKGPKKFSVYVKNDKGNVVKVNFGDPNMRIRKSDPKRRKSFRARHKCDDPGPKWKARYWSCRMW